MKKAEAEPLIVQEWRAWASQNILQGECRNGFIGHKFFDYLRRDGSWLLDFTGSADKGQDVHTMLLRRKEVID